MTIYELKANFIYDDAIWTDYHKKYLFVSLLDAKKSAIVLENMIHSSLEDEGCRFIRVKTTIKVIAEGVRSEPLDFGLPMKKEKSDEKR